MSEPTVDDLLLVPYEEIEYTSLSSALLLQLAVQQMEPFMATSALSELAIRRGPEVRAAALEILSAPWDRYLTAYALTSLFEGDTESGLVAMERLLPECRDTVILAAMMDNVLLELEVCRSRYGGFCAALWRRVWEIDPAEFKDREERDRFLGAVRG